MMAASSVTQQVRSAATNAVNSIATLMLSPPRTSFGSVVLHGSRDLPLVALTFDDGPARPSTEWTLDALATCGVPGTFFCIGTMVLEHPDVVQRMIAEGHEVGSHSMHHSRKDAVSLADTDHLDEASDVIERVTGCRPTLYRPPWGWLTPWERKRAEARGMRVIGWDVYPDDWKTPEPPAEATVGHVVQRVQNGSIVLLHDAASHLMDCAKTETARAIPMLVETLTDRNYEFVTVSELLRRTELHVAQDCAGVAGPQ